MDVPGEQEGLGTPAVPMVPLLWCEHPMPGSAVIAPAPEALTSSLPYTGFFFAQQVDAQKL